MHTRSLVAASMLMAAWASCLPAAIHAQRNNRQVVEMTLFTGLQGQVMGVRPGMIQWTDDSGQSMYVKLLPQTQVQVKGTADPEFLRPGLFVRFHATVNQQGEVDGPLSELTIFTPRDGYAVGVFNDSDDPTATDGPLLIAGQLRNLRNTKFIVTVGQQQVRGELSEDVTVNLELNDYSLAQPGDKFTVTGVGFERDKIEARGIEIILAEQLSTGKKKPRRNRPAPESQSN